LTCPRCGHRESYNVGTVRCAECSLEIRVEIRGDGKKKAS
jgi:ribosomal protein L37E